MDTMAQSNTERQINDYAERVGIDLRKAHRKGVLRLVKQAAAVSYNLSLIPGSDSPMARQMLRSYERLVERIGYDPIPL